MKRDALNTDRINQPAPTFRKIICGWALASVVLIGGTAAFEYWAVGDFQNWTRFRSNAGREWGTIVGLRDVGFERPGYLPMVEFEVNGITYQFEDDFVTSRRFEIGAQYEVLFDLADPTKAELHRPDEGRFMLAVHSFIGLIIFAFGVGSAVLAFQAMRKRRKRPVEENAEQLALP